ncbi:LysE/ArgO family amino acid transporter [Sulfurospirillum sp. hDNRA2]|uniref:LysE/ArgO family amino acid transporter n=1 Tax=Sulfurospirillum sp. hDNRA2 TaxID=3237298 RepID=UPI0020B838C0|nr:LysE/ArgO family amino acid transporter [Sulfurospirillum sp. DNRA8]MCP3650826.1 LysE/ArgO family amino acid transporter [Sulfurospirillum sp. DNRA8]MCR1809671.1 LysE/ArgO family amino acid transporter [Sulfurospirillum sp. DNRA8]
MNAFISGFSLGFSLILAIGAQNAFVLKQGIKKEHVFVICLICALSDAVLIFAGVFGFGYLVEQFPTLQTVAKYGGFVFLVTYGLKSFYTAWSMTHELNPLDQPIASLVKTVLIVLAFTWLNPHVYLDTVILLGSVSTKFGSLAPMFGLGAMSASFVFFFSLGYGARILTPVFQKPLSWKILEVLIGIIMLSLAWMLFRL